MILEDASDPFDFDPDPKSVEDLIICPSCCQERPVKDWERGEFINCDLCGEHTALRCPVCQCAFDHVYADPFKVIPAAGGLHL